LPRIEQFLGNERAGEAAAQALKDLKAKAKITYQGEFASAEGKTAAPVAATPAPAASEPKASALAKGVAGLK